MKTVKRCALHRCGRWVLACAALMVCGGLHAAVTNDVSLDFSGGTNPSGAWSYGYLQAFGGPFGLLQVRQSPDWGNGVHISTWQLSALAAPIVGCNTSGQTATFGGGQAVLPPGALYFWPGQDGAAQNYGVIRFTVPPDATGTYQIEAAVQAFYTSGPCGDSDFHVLTNGVEAFGVFLPAATGAAVFTNTAALVAGDVVDFAIGRGQDGREYGSGLKIGARLIQLTVEPPPPPIIQAQPQSQVVLEGQSATFRVEAEGAPPLSYQWYFNSNAVVEATNATLVLRAVMPWQAGTFSVVVSNAGGIAVSDNATLRVVEAPPGCEPVPDGLVAWWGMDGTTDDLVGSANFVIYGAPHYAEGEVDRALALGGAGVYGRALASPALNVGVGPGLSVEAWINPTDASGMADLLEWNNRYGGIGAHFSIATPTSFGGGPGSLFANLVDTAGVSHQVTTVTGLLASGIFQHVAVTYDKASGLAALYLNGSQVALTNLGSFTPQTSYDLYLGMRPSGPYTGMRFAGLMDEVSLYGLALSQAQIQGIYNAGRAGKCKPVRAPVIQAQPQSRVAVVGDSVTFRVEAVGTPPLSYQWYFNSNVVLEATNATLVLAAVTSSQAGTYSVVVSNAGGIAVSDNATLATLETPPACQPVPDGLVAWWGMDGSAEDLVGSADFVIYGDPHYAAGEVDQALALDGSDDYGKALASPVLNVGVGPGLSIEAWINPTDASRLADLLEWNDRYGGIGAHFSIATPTSFGGGPGSLFANLVDTEGLSHQVTTLEGLLVSGEFQHVAVTYDKASGLAALYLNGNQVALTNLGSFTPQTSYDLYLGIRPSGPISGIRFEGLMDEVSLYGRALLPAQIQAIYNAGRAGKCKVTRAPVIQTQPQSQAAVEGDSVTFQVGAAGTPLLSYQWYFNSNVVLDATNAALVLEAVTSAQAGTYSVVVSNAQGIAVSDNATLTVGAAPACEPVPESLVAWWGMDGSADDLVGTANFTLHGSPHYAAGEVGQALALDGSDDYGKALARPILDVGMGSGLSIEAWINPSDASRMADLLEWNNGHGSIGTHFAISVPNDYGGGAGSLYANLVDSWGVSHQVTTPPGLLASHAFQHVALTYDKASGMAALYLNGQGVALTNLGSFTPQTSYDLYLGMRPSGPVSGTWFAGLTDELSLYNRALQPAEIGGIFSAGRSGKCRTPLPPFIDIPPRSLAVPVGGDATFAVLAGGTAPLAYQWLFNGDIITDATNQTLVLTNLVSAQAGGYSVWVSNSVGSVTSSVATLTVEAAPPSAPVILEQPQGAVATVGSSLFLTVMASGSEPLSYQWRWNGMPLADATNESLPLVNVQLDYAGTYSVVVGNPGGSVVSQPAVVDVADFSGGAVLFANRLGTVEAFVYDVDGLTKLEGAGFLAQLFAGTNETSLHAVGAAVPFGTGPSAGLFDGGTRYIPDVAPGGTATVQVRAWECAAGPTFDQARVNGGKAGVSDTLAVVTGGGLPPVPPAWLLGLHSFSLQPPGTPLPLTNAPNAGLNAPVILQPGLVEPPRPGGGGRDLAPAAPSKVFRFTVRGEIGARYVIETSTDLRQWAALTNVFDDVGPVHITDPNPPDGPRRFYRVRAAH